MTFSRIDLSPLIGLLCALLALFALSSHDHFETRVPTYTWFGCDLSPPSSRVQLKVESENVYYWDGRQIDGVQLKARLDAFSTVGEFRRVLIHPAKSVTFDQLVSLLQQFDARSIPRSVN